MTKHATPSIGEEAFLAGTSSWARWQGVYDSNRVDWINLRRQSHCSEGQANADVQRAGALTLLAVGVGIVAVVEAQRADR